MSALVCLSAAVNVQAQSTDDSGTNMQVALASEAFAHREARDSAILVDAKVGYLSAVYNREGFDSGLKEFRGSYAIYSSLSDHDKEKVYFMLKDGATLDIMRDQITDVRLGRF